MSEINEVQKKQRLISPANILFALMATLLAVCLSVVIVLNLRPLYYADIKALDIPAYSGLSEEVIKENYDALIDYNLVFNRDKLEFPTLPMSETGEIHFAEVKVIFDAVQILAVVLLVVTIVFAVILHRRGRYEHLRLSAFFMIALPLVLGAIIAVGWDFFFVKFHELFFNNDYWVFSAETDPVITILPDTFFLHCALLILALVILCAVVSLLLYRARKRKVASVTA